MVIIPQQLETEPPVFRNPILVTGAPRSGTTWVGKIIAFAPNVRYIHEPFGAGYNHLLIRKYPFRHWFRQINDANHDNYAEFVGYLTDTLGFTYDLRKELSAIHGLGDCLRLIRRLGRLPLVRYRDMRPLVRDPLALFSAEWLARRFSMQVIVLIRHPVAMVSSLKLHQWYLGRLPIILQNWVDQPELLAGMLGPFADEIVKHANDKRVRIQQCILLWNCIYHVVHEYQARHPNWLFVRHEDLSRDPIEGFRSIYAFLGLPFRKLIARKIVECTRRGNPVEPAKKSEVKRDSKANLLNWKKRLTAEEIRRILSGTSVVSSVFYPDNDWQRVFG